MKRIFFLTFSLYAAFLSVPMASALDLRDIQLTEVYEWDSTLGAYHQTKRLVQFTLVCAQDPPVFHQFEMPAAASDLQVIHRSSTLDIQRYSYSRRPSIERWQVPLKADEDERRFELSTAEWSSRTQLELFAVIARRFLATKSCLAATKPFDRAHIASSGSLSLQITDDQILLSIDKARVTFQPDNF